MVDKKNKIASNFTSYFEEIENQLAKVYNLNSNLYLLLFAVPVLCFLSCSKPVDKQTLLAYVNDPDNGLKKEIQSADYKISLTYKPTDLLVEQELGKDSVVSEEQIEAKRKQFRAYRYFTLSMSAGDKDMVYSGAVGNQNFNELVTKINFRLAEYIYAVEDRRDTVYLADYFIPNLYGMGGKTQVLLAFPKKEKEEYKELNIYLKELGFGLGNQKFTFEKEAFEKAPSLKLKI